MAKRLIVLIVATVVTLATALLQSPVTQAQVWNSHGMLAADSRRRRGPLPAAT